MTSTQFAREKIEQQGASDGTDPALGGSAQGLLSTLLSRMGLRSPTLREMLEIGLKEAPEADAAFSTEEREMLRRLLRFGGLRVEDIMVPRADIIALEESEPLSELLAHVRRSGRVAHSAVQRDAR